MNSDQDIALMVKSATSQAQAVPLEEQCQDLEKIHEGKLLPGWSADMRNSPVGRSGPWVAGSRLI